MRTVTTSARRGKHPKWGLPIACFAALAIFCGLILLREKRGAPTEPPPLEERDDIENGVVVSQDAKPPMTEIQMASVPMQSAKVEKPEKLIVHSASTNAIIRKPGQMVLPDGQIITFKPPKEGTTTTVFANGKVFECDSEGGFKDVTPKPIFETDFEEQLIGMAVVGKTFIPAFLKGHTSDEIAPILDTPITIYEDDPDDVVATKEAVAEFKEGIKAFLADGGTWNEFVDEVAAVAEEERHYRGMLLQKLSKLLHNGEKEEAQKLYRSFNAIIEEKGFSKIDLPPRLRKRLGLEGTEP